MVATSDHPLATPVEDLIVVDPENKPVGIIDNQDLPKLRMV
jgi:predicted transcriptional regulator